MNWSEQVNNYCERVDFTFWSEPINALTNLSFLIAALLVALMLKGPDKGARLLLVILGCIGIGSFLFHTFATRWSALMDVFPILLFILTYIFLATTRFLALPLWAGLLAVAAFFPFSAAVGWAVTNSIGTLNGSVAYVPVPILITLYAFALRRSAPDTARGLLIGVALLVASLTFRTIDAAVCPSLPIGTHFLWHVLNGIMLGWMILVMHRALPLAKRPMRG